MHSFSFTDLVNLNIYYVPGTFDSPRLNKNPLNGWGKGKNIQVNPCFDQTLHQETVYLRYIRVNPQGLKVIGQGSPSK